jgi:hypothetical protein
MAAGTRDVVVRPSEEKQRVPVVVEPGGRPEREQTVAAVARTLGELLGVRIGVAVLAPLVCEPERERAHLATRS